MRRLLLVTLATVLMTGPLAGPGAGAVDPYVEVRYPENGGFEPDVKTSYLGGTVYWKWMEGTHKVRDRVYSLGILNSGPPESTTEPGAVQFQYTFAAAGTYLYLCTQHPTTMLGKVTVPMSYIGNNPAGGMRLEWATSPAEGDWVYDVQHRIPGGPWQLWKNGTVNPSGIYPSGGSTQHEFRSRQRDSASGQSTGWSRVLSTDTPT